MFYLINTLLPIVFVIVTLFHVEGKTTAMIHDNNIFSCNFLQLRLGGQALQLVIYRNIKSYD
jgi:hypothetical protein